MKNRWISWSIVLCLLVVGIIFTVEKMNGSGRLQTIRTEDEVVNDWGYDRPEKVIQFLSNVEQGNKDQIRLTSYTIEGDPIITEMIYDGKVIHYKYDTRKDAFGTQKLYEKTCEAKFIKNIGPKSESYLLGNCDGARGMVEIFHLPLK